MPILERISNPQQFSVTGDGRHMSTVSLHVKCRSAAQVFVNLRTRKRFEIVSDVRGGLLRRAETRQKHQRDYE